MHPQMKCTTPPRQRLLASCNGFAKDRAAARLHALPKRSRHHSHHATRNPDVALSDKRSITLAKTAFIASTETDPDTCERAVAFLMTRQAAAARIWT